MDREPDALADGTAPDLTVEPPAVRLRRLRMRSARRGIREMDLVLGGFAEAELEDLPPASLEAFEMFLSENDQDIYQWLSGRSNVPAAHEEIVGRIRSFIDRGRVAQRLPKS
jgi:antitoxin CptB